MNFCPIHLPRWGAAALLLVEILMIGCAHTTPPTIELAGANVASSSSEATIVNFQIKLTNPGDEQLPLRELNYAVSLDGQNVATLRRSAESTMPQHGIIMLNIPAVIPHNALGVSSITGDHTCMLTGNLTYIAPGAIAEVMLDTGVRIPAAPFSFTSELNFSQ